MGRLSWIILWAQCNHEGLYEREVGAAERKRDLTMEPEDGAMWGHESRNANFLEKLEKSRK